MPGVATQVAGSASTCAVTRAGRRQRQRAEPEEMPRGALEQPLLRGRTAAAHAEMLVGSRGRAPAAGGSRNETFFEKIRLDDVFERFGIFGQRRRDRGDADRAAAVLLDDRPQETRGRDDRARVRRRPRGAALRRRPRAVIRPSARTSAKSRTRRSRRFAMRGVPRLRARDRCSRRRRRSERRARRPSGARCVRVRRGVVVEVMRRCRSARAAAPSACRRASSHRPA